MQKFNLLNLDSVEALKTLPAESVHLFVTSPPYDNLRTYGGHKWNFEETAKEMFRVLVDGGIACWNVGDSVVDGSETLTSFKQAIYFKEVVGFRMHDTMIYEKSNGSKPDGTRYHSCFEYVFVLSKGKPRCFNPIKDKKNVTAGLPCFGKHTMRKRDGSMTVQGDRKVAAEFGMRSNVWKGNTRGQEDMGKSLGHPAMMPKWLANDLVLSWSNPGDLIADPFAGSGTTGKAALETGRSAWLNEINAPYIPLIEQTCQTTIGFQL